MQAMSVADALRELQKELRNHVKFNVRKHFSLMNADAAATKALLHAEDAAPTFPQLNKAYELAQLIARMKTLSEFGDDQPGNDDYVDTLDNLIATARQISPETRTAAQDENESKPDPEVQP